MTRVIRKTYRIADLVLSRRELAHRCEMISRHTRAHPPEVTFEMEEVHLNRITTAITHQGHCTGPSPEEARHLAAQIDSAHRAGLVHGDIRPKNLLRTSSGCYLTDWEPALFQLLGGRLAPMVTPPAYHPQDARAHRITRLTDLYGFALLRFALRPSQIIGIIENALERQPDAPAGWMADQAGV